MNRPGKFTPSSGRAKGRTPSTDVEQAIVDAAEQLLTHEGPEALTVRGIATAAGVAPMSVYNRLGGKQGVLDALLVRGFDGLNSTIRDVSTGDPFEDLVEAGRRYRQFARDHPAQYSLMFQRAVKDYEPSAMALGHAHATFKELELLVRHAMAAGVIAEGDPADIAQRLWATCHGSVSLELNGILFCEDIPQHQDETALTMLRGLRTPD